MAKKRFLRSLIWIFWLGLLGFIAYRAFLTAPLEEGRRYLIYSRLNGYQDQILEPGQYFISWQNLIPGNVRLLAIPLSVQRLYFQKHFRLPSSEGYQLLLPRLGVGSEQSGIAPPLRPSYNPFAYQIEMSISYCLLPEEVLAILRNIRSTLLAESVGDSPENSETLPHKEPEANANTGAGVLRGILDDVSIRLRRRLDHRVNQEIESLFSDSGPDRTIAGLQKYFGNIVSDEFPELELLEVRINRYQAPDLKLYATVREYYQDLLTQISAQSLSRLLEQQDRRVAEQLYLQNLERIGQILTKYPVLIQYFSVIRGGEKNLLLLPDNNMNIPPRISGAPDTAE